MQFSVWTMPSREPDETLEVARHADETGWHGVWYADHFMPNTGTTERKRGAVHECWTMLAAIATATTRVRVGPLVSPTTVHHPALLANRATTMDHLSGGRFVLGMGAGWQVNEHAAYGIDLLAPAPRVDRFEEAIQVVRSLLDDDSTTFAGSHFAIEDAPCDPAPVQDRIPILVGTPSPRMMRITARHAQEWNAWAAPTLAATRLEQLGRACEQVDVDPSSLRTSVQALVTVTDDDAAARRLAGDPGESRHVAGSVAQVVDAMGTYADLGFDEFILPDITLGDTRAQRLEAFDVFRTEVIDQLS